MLRLIIIAALFMHALTAQAEVGEFEIRDVSPLNPAQLTALRNLVQSNPNAQAIADKIQVEVDDKDLLIAEPRPLEVIHYEGLVNTDPRRIATVAQLREMDDIALLMRHWQLTGDAQTTDALRRYILAWADTYQPTGNDVNENKFWPLLVAYEALQEHFAEQESMAVDAWVRDIGQRHLQAVQESSHFTNRYTKHVRLTAICGMILEKQMWVETAHDGVKRFVSQSLYGDGSSRDLEIRDTLTYHGSALKPVIELAMLAGPDGANLYVWQNDQGGSIQKSVNYVVPYALGEKTREEWKNSKISLDQKRAAAGLDHYQPGSLYDPQNALELMELASYFDPDLMRVVAHLLKTDQPAYSSWRMLTNEAVHRAAP